MFEIFGEDGTGLSVVQGGVCARRDVAVDSGQHGLLAGCWKGCEAAGVVWVGVMKLGVFRWDKEDGTFAKGEVYNPYLGAQNERADCEISCLAIGDVVMLLGLPQG